MSLSPSQTRFFALLANYPKIRTYWNESNGSYDSDRLAEDLPALSENEQRMATFFVSVWNGNDGPQFGLIDAVQNLPETELKVLQEWLQDPYFP